MKLRRAATLVELLVTLAVVSALTVLVLPSVKGLMADRKGSQSAILVKNYLEAARARAIASGVPVAVVLERLSSRPYDADENGRIEGVEVGVSGTASPVANDSDPFINYVPYNACIRLSMAETPLPLSSDTIGLPGVVAIGYTGNVPTNVNTIQTLPPNAPFYRVGIFLQTVDINGNVVNLPCRDYIESILVAGNEVSFGLSSAKFVIAIQPTTQTSSGLQVLVLSFLSSNVAINPTEIAINNLTPSTADSFTVYSKPKPIAVQNVSLPKGMCIDLSVSGFAEPKKLHFYNSSSGVTPDPLASARDYRLRLSSAFVSPISMSGPTALAPVPQPAELRPVYIVFNPDGTFGRIYGNSPTVASVRPGTALSIVDTADDLFLHIARIDQVNVSTIAPFAGSLDDPSNFIVRLSPKSGAVAASPIGGITTDDYGTGSLLGTSPSLGDFVSLARKRAFGQFATGQ